MTRASTPLSHFTDEKVLEMRRLYREGGITQKELVARFGGTSRTMSRALTGGTFKHLPGAITPYDGVKKRRQLTPEVALFMRLQYETEGVSIKTLSDRYGLHSDGTRKILLGKMYREVPGALERLKPAGKPRKLTEAEVIEARRKYRTQYVSMHDLSKEYGIGTFAMANILRGYAYKELPYAVPARIKMLRRGGRIIGRRSAQTTTS